MRSKKEKFQNMVSIDFFTVFVQTLIRVIIMNEVVRDGMETIQQKFQFKNLHD